MSVLFLNQPILTLNICQMFPYVIGNRFDMLFFLEPKNCLIPYEFAASSSPRGIMNTP